MKNHYQTLGIEVNATNEQIKSAYKEHVKRFHPDKQSGDKFFEEKFKEVQEAYEVLSDFNKRSIYDSILNTYKSTNGNSSKNRSYDDLKREFEKELKKREEEIKRKYQTPEQRAEEEEQKRLEKIEKELVELNKLLEIKKGYFIKLEIEIKEINCKISNLETSKGENIIMNLFSKAKKSLF